jgi:Dolichyl-phosphate-mannose-protein mannosyltransferase
MFAALTLLEIFLLCLGGILLFHKPSYRLSETFSSGIFLALLILSFIFQITFFAGMPQVSPVIEISIVIYVLIALIINKNTLLFFYKRIKNFIFENRFISLSIAIAWSYLALQSIFIPPSNSDSLKYHLTKVFLFQNEKSLFPSQYSHPSQVTSNLGSDILFHAFLRFHTDYGVAIFSFLAYLSIGFGTYALCRRYSSCKASITAAFVIVSLPQLVFQATNTKNDIFVTSAAIFCLLAVHRLLEKLDFRDFSFLVLGLFFGISAKQTFILFIFPFSIFFGYLLLKKYGFKSFTKLMISNWKYFLIIIFASIVLSQIWLAIHNYILVGNFAGYAAVNKQTEGLKGGIANLVRTLFDSVDLLQPTDIIFRGIFKVKLSSLISNVYNLYLDPIFGDAGCFRSSIYLPLCHPLTLIWRPQEDESWYGPFGFILIIPAILYVAIKGRKSLRAYCLILIIYLCLFSYVVNYASFNRFLLLFFAASGAPVAYILDLYFKKDFIHRLIRYLSILFLFYACLFNLHKPLLTTHNLADVPHSLAHDNIWIKTRFGFNRTYYAENNQRDFLVKNFSEYVPSGSKVALITSPFSKIYHYLLLYPDIKFTLITLPIALSQSSQYDYVLCLNEINAPPLCELDKNFPSARKLWSSRQPEREIQLIQLLK